jgi:hypothetical protein
MVAILLV